MWRTSSKTQRRAPSQPRAKAATGHAILIAVLTFTAPHLDAQVQTFDGGDAISDFFDAVDAANLTRETGFFGDLTPGTTIPDGGMVNGLTFRDWPNGTQGLINSYPFGSGTTVRLAVDREATDNRFQSGESVTIHFPRPIRALSIQAFGPPTDPRRLGFIETPSGSFSASNTDFSFFGILQAQPFTRAVIGATGGEFDFASIVWAARALTDPVPNPDNVISSQRDRPQRAQPVLGRNGFGAVVFQQLDGDGFGIFAQLVRNFAPTGPIFRVNPDPSGNQINPSAALDSSNRLLVTWEEAGTSAVSGDGRVMSIGPGGGIVGRIFQPESSQPAGDGLVQVSSASSGASDPKLRTNAAGGLAITWRESGGILTRLFDRNGRAATDPIPVSPSGLAEQPEIAAAANGDFVVVWKGEPLANRSSRSGQSAILGRLFESTGQPKSAPFAIASGNVENPSLAGSQSGGFVVLWQAGQAGDSDLQGQLFARDGSPRGGPLTITSSNEADDRNARVAMNSIGEFVVTWERRSGGAQSGNGGSAIVGRFFDSGGSSATNEVTAATTGADGNEPTEPEVSIADDDSTTVSYTRRDAAGDSQGVFVTTLEPEIATGSCVASGEALCLLDGRYRVTAQWRNQEGGTGIGTGVALTGDTGYFWFFTAANIELVVKVLDACGLSGNVWAFAGGLTNVEVTIQIDDTIGGSSQTYSNQLGEPFQLIADTGAFACDAATSTISTKQTKRSELFDDVQNRLEVELRVSGHR